MSDAVAVLFDEVEVQRRFPVDAKEASFLAQSAKLLKADFPDHALTDLWNASIHNLRRRVEQYSVDLFLTSIKDEQGRKKYNTSGDTLVERWENVDDALVVIGSEKIGILNQKAQKTLEMINWMRNHASSSHESDELVTKKDVYAIALMLQVNLFELPMPDPGSSPAGFFSTVKTSALDAENISLLIGQIRTYSNSQIRVLWGFIIDAIYNGKEPEYTNIQNLYEAIWPKTNDDLRRTLGEKVNTLVLNKAADTSLDKDALSRLLDFLKKARGISYIPDVGRAAIFKDHAKNIAKAKNTSYGWSLEFAYAKELADLGTCVPSTVFEIVYQEILSVWCGNYWGRSQAYTVLKPFIEVLNDNKKEEIANMFIANERVKSELFQAKPKSNALSFLGALKASTSNPTTQAIIDHALKVVNSY